MRLNCLDWRVNRGIRFEVVLDGTPCGKLVKGQSLELSVPAGSHEIAVSTVRFGRVDMTIEVPSADRITLACTANSAGLRRLATSSQDANDGPDPILLVEVNGDSLPAEPDTDLDSKLAIFAWQVEQATDANAGDLRVMRSVMKHYTAWNLAGLLLFAAILYFHMSQPNPNTAAVAVDSFLLLVGAASLSVRLAIKWRLNRTATLPIEGSNE